LFGSLTPVREEQFHPLTGNGVGASAARAMCIVMILVLFIHGNKRGKHFRSSDCKWGLTIKTTKV
jgi:hypothetical protein